MGDTDTDIGDFSHVQRVGVLGAGVAGLQVAEQLSQAGLECVLFEKADDVGGVWRQNYADFGLQVPKELYEFPSFPFPAKYGSFPKGPEVQDYLRSFALEKGIYAMTRLRTAVLAMTPRPDDKRGWRVRFQKDGEEACEEDFDFMIVATGMYGTPLVPKVPGMEHFSGTTIPPRSFMTKRWPPDSVSSLWAVANRLLIALWQQRKWHRAQRCSSVRCTGLCHDTCWTWCPSSGVPIRALVMQRCQCTGTWVRLGIACTAWLRL